MRKNKIYVGEYYHVFNRGVDKRVIFKDQADYARFLKTLSVFNTIEPVGSLFELEYLSRGKIGSIREEKCASQKQNTKRLVDIVAYCLLSNHFHLILKEKEEGGISEFMKRVTGGYAWYFNNKHKRSGALFQGRYKAVHIQRNAQLLHVSAYVNLNHFVKLGVPTAKTQAKKTRAAVSLDAYKISVPAVDIKVMAINKNIFSSWKEFMNSNTLQGICSGKDIVLDQFNRRHTYEQFALDALMQIQKHKALAVQLEEFGVPTAKENA